MRGLEEIKKKRYFCIWLPIGPQLHNNALNDPTVIFLCRSPWKRVGSPSEFEASLSLVDVSWYGQTYTRPLCYLETKSQNFLYRYCLISLQCLQKSWIVPVPYELTRFRCRGKPSFILFILILSFVTVYRKMLRK